MGPRAKLAGDASNFIETRHGSSALIGGGNKHTAGSEQTI